MCIRDRINSLNKTIEGANEVIAKAQAEIKDIQSKCEHKHIKTNPWDTADCEDCGKHFSWYCSTSPTKECDYNQEDGGYDDDHCIYCGQPEERK